MDFLNKAREEGADMSGRATGRTFVQQVLRRVGIYERLRASRLYDAYWTMQDRQIIADRNAEIDFYRRTLEGMQPGDLVFDIGANQGYKTDMFVRLGASVVAVDPDAANAALLKDRFIKFRLSPKPVTVVGQAVSEKTGAMTMWVDAPGSPMNTLSTKWVDTLRHDDKRFGERMQFAISRTVLTTTIDELMSAHGLPFYIKIDVEGHEPSALRGLKRPVRYLSFEVNLPEFNAEGLECLELLTALEPSGQFNYSTDARRGLEMAAWASGAQFRRIFETIAESSVEVWWRTLPI
jgi:FkbM family methyltransferase